MCRDRRCRSGYGSGLGGRETKLAENRVEEAHADDFPSYAQAAKRFSRYTQVRGLDRRERHMADRRTSRATQTSQSQGMICLSCPPPGPRARRRVAGGAFQGLARLALLGADPVAPKPIDRLRPDAAGD